MINIGYYRSFKGRAIIEAYILALCQVGYAYCLPATNTTHTFYTHKVSYSRKTDRPTDIEAPFEFELSKMCRVRFKIACGILFLAFLATLLLFNLLLTLYIFVNIRVSSWWGLLLNVLTWIDWIGARWRVLLNWELEISRGLHGHVRHQDRGQQRRQQQQQQQQHDNSSSNSNNDSMTIAAISAQLNAFFTFALKLSRKIDVTIWTCWAGLIWLHLLG